MYFFLSLFESHLEVYFLLFPLNHADVSVRLVARKGNHWEVLVSIKNVLRKFYILSSVIEKKCVFFCVNNL